MAATALIKITQGANTDSAGVAVIGTKTDGSVTFSNGSNTDVVQWKWEVLYVPPGSIIPLTVQGPDTIPTFVMSQPDANGCYRIRLTVWDAIGNQDQDIRDLGIRCTNGLIIPPYQGNPPPLPIAGLAAKPSETNFKDQPYGWAGDHNADVKLLHQALENLDLLLGGATLNIVSPTSLTGNVNDYNPTGLSTAGILRISSDASRAITGLAATPTVLVKTIYNIGSNPIVLAHQSTSSVAANRLFCPGLTDIIMQPGDVINVFYDTVSTVWRLG
jgi:hypothetical protein